MNLNEKSFEQFLQYLFSQKKSQVPEFQADWEDSLMFKINNFINNEKVVFVNFLLPKLSLACSLLLIAFNLFYFYNLSDSLSDITSLVIDDSSLSQLSQF